MVVIFVQKLFSNLRVLTNLEIEVLGKGLGFSPKRIDFHWWSRKTKCKRYFRIDITDSFSEISVAHNNSTWDPQQGHPALELFLSQMEVNGFPFSPSNTTKYNLAKEEWIAMKGLTKDSSIAIKLPGKGSCVIVRNGADYLLEA